MHTYTAGILFLSYSIGHCLTDGGHANRPWLQLSEAGPDLDCRPWSDLIGGQHESIATAINLKPASAECAGFSDWSSGFAFWVSGKEKGTVRIQEVENVYGSVDTYGWIAKYLFDMPTFG